MAFSTDTSIDFSTSVGYILSDATISGGEVTISTGISGVATCQTPSVDTSTWVGVNRVSFTQEQDVDFIIKYLCSFDGGTTWKRNVASFWENVDESNISNVGMSASELSSVREWTIVSSSVIFLIGMIRSDSSSQGNVSQITISYLASGAEEAYVVQSEPSPNETLEADLGIQPEFPINISYEQNTKPFESEGNYATHISMVTTPRRTFDGSFRGLTSSQRDSVVSFLESHEDVPFTWESAPLTSGTIAVYSSKEPEVKQSGVGVFDITFEFTERL